MTLTRKVRTPMQPEEALRYLDHLAAWPVAVLDYEAVRAAAQLSSGKSLSFWDALVIVAPPGPDRSVSIPKISRTGRPSSGWKW